jgi:hypothetical protein
MVTDGGEPSVQYRTYDHITTSDNARAQYGDQYHHNYFGPVHQSATSSTLPISDESETEIAKALKFDGMDMRRATIKLSYGDTCQWFFDSAEYKKWRDDSMLVDHHGFL